VTHLRRFEKSGTVLEAIWLALVCFPFQNTACIPRKFRTCMRYFKFSSILQYSYGKEVSQSNPRLLHFGRIWVRVHPLSPLMSINIISQTIYLYLPSLRTLIFPPIILKFVVIHRGRFLTRMLIKIAIQMFILPELLHWNKRSETLVITYVQMFENLIMFCKSTYIHSVSLGTNIHWWIHSRRVQEC